MTWFASYAYQAALLAMAVGALLADWWLLAAGRIVRKHRRVPHWKIHRLQAATEAWIEGLRRDHSSEEPLCPARSSAAGAGTGPSLSAPPDDGPRPRSAASDTPQPRSGGPGPQQPVSDKAPRSLSLTGVQARTAAWALPGGGPGRGGE